MKKHIKGSVIDDVHIELYKDISYSELIDMDIYYYCVEVVDYSDGSTYCREYLDLDLALDAYDDEYDYYNEVKEDLL